MTPLEDHVDKNLKQMRVIFEMAAQIINELPENEKVFIKDLCSVIGSTLEPPRTGTEIYPLVRFFIDGCPEVYILKGRTGGLYKGTPAK